MRVLVTSTPGAGHLHPLVPLAQELVAVGHEVVWATAPSACTTVSGFGFRSVPCGLDGALRRSKVMERVPGLYELPPRERRAVMLSMTFGEVAAPVMRDDLVEVFDEFQPDVVVHDYAELAAAPMSSARAIGCVSVGFSGAVSDAVQGAVEVSVAPVWEREGVQINTATFNGDLLLYPFPDWLDTPRADVPSAPMRPASFDRSTATDTPQWVQSFGADRPGVYVTYGTEIGPRAPWSAIFDGLADLDADVVATVGGQIDPASLGATPANIRVEQYVPQSFVLERATVAVSHGGAGTLIGAATTATPQLCLPIAADQWDNADRLAASGAGLLLEEDERDPDSIFRAVERLLHEGSIQTHANLLRDHFAAMPHPAELVPTIESLA
jgi:UDP:flavonoid glycosyltransferase YjiC (YdhE family)